MYVAVTGKGKARVIQFREDKRIPKTNKKKCTVIKTIGNYEQMLAENPNVIHDLKEEAKRLTAEKKAKNAPRVLTLTNQPIQQPDDSTPSYRFGHAVIKQLWKDMKLDKLFQSGKKKNSPQLEQILFSLLVHRLTNPKSVLFSYHDIPHYAGLSQLGLSQWYKALDELADLENELIDHLCHFFEQKVSRDKNYVFYDVTTYAFESTQQGNLRLFGFSKDHKNNEVQVVMGLLMDSHGIPISYTLFPGNTMDQKTLQTAVDDIKHRYHMSKVVIIADRGLNGKDNLEFLQQNGHDFVLAYTLKKSTEELKRLALEKEGWLVVSRDDNGEPTFCTKTLDLPMTCRVEMSAEECAALPKQRGRKRKYKDIILSTTLHLTWSRDRARKDQTDRNRLLKKAKVLVDKPAFLKGSIKKGRNQYLTFAIDTEQLALDEEKIREQEQYDGYYAIITNNTTYTTEEVVRMYRNLWKIEESFRVLKTDLKARPVYVWTDQRIRGHFALCYLALCMIRYLQYLYETKEKSSVSADAIKQALYTPSVTVVGEFPNVLLLPTNINETYLSLHKLFGLKPLTTAMTPFEFKQSTTIDIVENITKNRT